MRSLFRFLMIPALALTTAAVIPDTASAASFSLRGTSNLNRDQTWMNVDSARVNNLSIAIRGFATGANRNLAKANITFGDGPNAGAKKGYGDLKGHSAGLGIGGAYTQGKANVAAGEGIFVKFTTARKKAKAVDLGTLSLVLAATGGKRNQFDIYNGSKSLVMSLHYDGAKEVKRVIETTASLNSAGAYIVSRQGGGSQARFAALRIQAAGANQQLTFGDDGEIAAVPLPASAGFLAVAVASLFAWRGRNNGDG